MSPRRPERILRRRGRPVSPERGVLRSLVLGLLAALVLVAPARAAAPLTLHEVLDAVQASHPGFEVAQRQVERADATLLSARGGFDPTLSIRGKWTPIGYYDNGQVDALVRQATPLWGVGVYAGYRIGLGSYPVYRGDLRTLSGGEVRAGIDVPLWRGGPIDERRAAIQQARIGRGAARHERDAALLELERDAAKAYWSWVAAGQRLRVARDLLALAEHRGTGLQAQADAGALEPIVVVDNRRLVLDRAGKVVDAERTFQQASLSLSLYLRDADRNPIRVGEDRVPDALPEPGRIDIDAIESEVQRATQRRPDLAAQNAKRRASDVAVRLARNQRGPAVSVQTFVARDLGAGPAELAPTEWGAGLTVEMPLPLRAARGALQAARAERGAVDAQLRGLRDRIEAEVRAAWVGLRAAEQRVTLARAQVEAADALARAERTRLAEGASDLVIVNLRELAAADAAIQAIDALAEYQRAHADFMVATGRRPVS